MLLSVPYSLGYAVCEAGGLRNLALSVREGRWYYAAAVPVQASIDVGFTLAFVYTTAANALLLIGLNPLWSAVGGRLFLGDKLPLRTWAALVLALGCLLIILVPQATTAAAPSGGEPEPATDEAEDSSGQPSVLGNFISLGTGLMLAAYILIARKAGMAATATSSSSSSSSVSSSPQDDSGNEPNKPINLVGAAAIGASLSAAVSLGVQRARVLPSSFWTEEGWKFWLAAVGQGAGIGIVFVAMTVAPRYVTAAEIGTFCLLETLLGPLFVYLAYGDAPSTWTLIGGSLLLAVLALHESYPLLFGDRSSIDDSRTHSERKSGRRLFARNGSSRTCASASASADIREAEEPTQESPSLPCGDPGPELGERAGG
jgi:drug/metabolite transporter (DMT)-like permease